MAEHCPKRMNVWIDFLLIHYPLVFSALPAKLLDHSMNAEKNCVRFVLAFAFLCSYFHSIEF